MLFRSAAFVSLLGDAALRRRMGDAARQRAREVYDWRHIMGQYEALWTQQALRRQQALRDGQVPASAHPWPVRLDPWHGFGAYPTRQLGPRTPLALAWPDAQRAWAHWQGLHALKMVNYAHDVLPTPDEVRTVLHAAAEAAQWQEPEVIRAVWGPDGGPKGHAPAAWLVQGIAPARRAQVFRALLSLAKWGVLQRAPLGGPGFHEADAEAGLG